MANLVPNPCAETDLTGWTTISDATLARVTSVPGTTIPSPATTALRVDPDMAIECDVVSLGALTEGDWLAWAVDLSPGAAEDGGTWAVDFYWYDGASYYAGDPTIVLEDVAVEDGWTHHSGVVQVPTGCDGFGVYVTTFDQTTTYLYATLFSVFSVAPATRLTLTTSRRTYIRSTRLDLTTSRRTYIRSTRLDLVTSRATRHNADPQAVRLTLVTRRKTLVPQAVRLTLTTRRRTRGGPTRLTLTTARRTAAAVTRLTLTTERKTKDFASRLTLVMSRKTAAWVPPEQRPAWQGPWAVDVPYEIDDVVSFGGDTFTAVQAGTGNATTDADYWTQNPATPAGSVTGMATAQINGITLYPIQPMDPGGEPAIWDEIRHYDGSLVLHDVRTGVYEMSVPIMVSAASAAALDAAEESIRGACKAGGTFTWQSTDGPAKTYTIAPSDMPSFGRTKIREVVWRSYGTLVLKVMPA